MASVISDVSNKRSPVTFTAPLNAKEMATLMGIPFGEPNIAGLPTGHARHFAPDISIPTEGIVLGKSNFPGLERTMALSPRDLNRHCHCLGATGVGKSTVLENMIIEMMNQGHGVTFIDPRGDAIANLLDRVPNKRRKDVIVLDLTDSAAPVGFNVLDGDPYMATNQLMAVFDKLYDIYKMPQTADVLRSTTLTLSQQGMTLLDIAAVLAPTSAGQRLRDRVVAKVEEQALKDFWHQIDAMAEKPATLMNVVAPVLRRLRAFETYPNLRGCLGQARSKLDLDEVLSGNKIVFVNLSKGRLGEEESKLFGSLFVAKFWSATQRRAALPVDQRSPYFLVIDEFQNYVKLHVNFGDVLAEARKYGVGFVVAHQHLAQLPHELREAVMPNARQKILMQMSVADASVFAREIPMVKPEDLQNLGAYQALGRFVVGDQVLGAATFHTTEPRPSQGSAEAVLSYSRDRYGKPIAEVEAEIQARQRVTFKPEAKPQIGKIGGAA